MTNNDDLKPEYDFTGAELGKFYRNDIRIRIPIYLDVALQTRLERIAMSEGKPAAESVSQILVREAEHRERS